jgi:DNA-binding CsgD family transcriptional regulator
MPLLTRREDEVVRLVADGMKNGEIAQSLGVSEHSIRNYLYRIFDKLGVSSRVELILYAFNQRDQRN